MCMKTPEIERLVLLFYFKRKATKESLFLKGRNQLLRQYPGGFHHCRHAAQAA